MALNIDTQYSGRVTAPSANYPYGSSKNESSPGAGDGTPYELARADDIFGFQQALLKAAGITPSGNADTALASEYMRAIVELASGRAFNYDDSGIADAYVLDVQTDQQAPASLFDGLRMRFFAANDNTGACTANPFGEGVTDIKLPGGTVDPSAGQISAASETELVYRSTPSAHLELVGAVSGSQISAQHLQNVAVKGSVAASALTVEITGQDLASLAAANVGEVAFRSETLIDGDYDNVLTSAAVSMVLTVGGTLGFTSSEDGYIYIYGINNAGTMEIAIAKKAVFDESMLHTTVAVSAGSDSNNVLYSTTLRSNVPVRLLGRLRIATGVTPGEWNSAPTEQVPWTPAMKKTNNVIQSSSIIDGEVATGITAVPFDDTIPQNTEGDEVMTLAVTPKSSINILEIHATVFMATSVGGLHMTSALYQDSVADALAVGMIKTELNKVYPVTFIYRMIAGTVVSTTFKIRIGASSGTSTFNGASASRLFGGALASSIVIKELQA